MIKTYTCIMCPNGCEIEAITDDKNIISINGALCNKGKEYVIQELNDPHRNIASSILVNGGELPLASVRLSKTISKEKIFDVMDEIKKVSIDAPTRIGQVVIPDVLGLGADVIITKNVEKIK